MWSLLHTVRFAPRRNVRPLRRLAAALTVRQQRQRLARLDPHALRDIGLTDAEVSAEVARPAWDVPPQWLK